MFRYVQMQILLTRFKLKDTIKKEFKKNIKKKFEKNYISRIFYNIIKFK